MNKYLRIALNAITGGILYSKRSYSQEGEDLAVDRLLEEKKKGFYVDIGCHHPQRFSNTYLFYKKGWQGICIDPLPNINISFSKARPRDMVLNMGVGLNKGTLKYFMFNEPALNTFDEKLAHIRTKNSSYRIIKTIYVETDSLKSILDRQNIDKKIDLMSIDVEGLDLEVLKSNDWTKYRPTVIIAESLSSSLDNIALDDVYIYLKHQGYSLYAKTGNSLIFNCI